MGISPRSRLLEKNSAGVRTRIEISFLKHTQVRSRRCSGNSAGTTAFAAEETATNKKKIDII